SERDHREGDALPPHRERTDDRAEHRRAGDADEQAHFHRHAPLLGRVAAEIPGRAEKRGVPEGEQARETEKQVERAGEEREAEAFHEEDRIDAEGLERGEDRRGEERTVQEGERPAGRNRAQRSRPKRPFGRARSTIAMTRKTTVDEAAG